MSVIAEALRQLRSREAATAATGALREDLECAGVGFAAIGGTLEERWHRALAELAGTTQQLGAARGPVLLEGGAYPGAWIESTGSISAEVLTRFSPTVARHTLELFARHQRDDGLIPYKVIDGGPGYSQIQIVTPLARTVWHHHLLTGGDAAFLRTMYDAMARFDTWLARYRDTRGTGGVEAFCAFDTGHDLSPRFWHVPDRCHGGDARQVDTGVARLPFVAPDLTANVACQRSYLALIAQELGEDPAPWREAAATSRAALDAQCLHAEDGVYYDRIATGELLRLQSDVLLRVLACEVGDARFAEASLRRYLMNTGKFLAHGLTSVALDDPRFDANHTRNSWAGPVNLLTMIRAPHAFEHHGRHAELAIVTTPVLTALGRADRFPQCLDPWTGDAGYTSGYSPAILFFLDAVERLSGILPRPDGRIWLSGLSPTRLGHGVAARAIAYARRVDGSRYELAADDARVEVLRDGEPYLSFPRGWRVELDVLGIPVRVVGLAETRIAGTLRMPAGEVDLVVAGNEAVELDGVHASQPTGPGVVLPIL